MSKVGISELKARLSEHLRKVRRGQTLIVTDRGTPVARIVRYEEGAVLQVRRAVRKPSDLHLPDLPERPPDSLNVLLDDRAKR
jgi:prevent-host-death family protein